MLEFNKVTKYVENKLKRRCSGRKIYLLMLSIVIVSFEQVFVNHKRIIYIPLGMYAKHSKKITFLTP